MLRVDERCEQFASVTSGHGLRVVLSYRSGEASSTGHVLYPTEAEAFVQELAHFKISAIGSERFARSHCATLP